MSTQEVANRLVELCRQGKNGQAYQELYSPDIVSIEAAGEPREAKGMQAVQAKGEYFEKTTEVHSMEVSDPLVAANHFTVTMKMDSTNKETGERGMMEEICVYQVNEGKIAREQFFYPAE